MEATKLNNMKSGLLVVIFCIIISVSCSKMDDYKSFQGGKEIYYPGILDAAQVFSGDKRVLLYGLFNSDPKIVKYKVFWNGRENFIEKDIVRSSGVDTVRLYINNLTEGGTSFEVRTYDNQGRESVPVNVSGVVYGDNYRSGIINRGYNRNTTVYNATSKVLTIDWISVDTTAVFTNLEYTDINNQKKNIRVIDPEATKTFITDYKKDTDISINTAYLPTRTTIDTFYVAKKDIFRR